MDLFSVLRYDEIILNHTVKVCKIYFVFIFTLVHTGYMPEGVKKKTISMEEDLYKKALQRAEALGYESFSAYLQFLMEADTASRPDHVRSEKGLYTRGEKQTSLRLNESDGSNSADHEKDHGGKPDGEQ